MAKEIIQLSLMDIAPPSITGDRKIQNLITAIDPELLNVSQDIREAFIISRINELPEEVLDLLAWQWHVDFYDIAHTIEAKRAMVQKSISWHKKKGTRGAILDALAMLGVEARFTSWQDLQDEGAQPYTFVIDAKLTNDFWERVDWTKPTQTIRRAIEESKAVRSWMSKLYIYMETDAQQDISIGTGTVQATHHDISIVQGTSSNADLNISIGTGTFQTWTHDIKHVQGTHSETDSILNVGANVIQSTHHDIDILQVLSLTFLLARVHFRRGHMMLNTYRLRRLKLILLLLLVQM